MKLITSHQIIRLIQLLVIPVSLSYAYLLYSDSDISITVCIPTNSLHCFDKTHIFLFLIRTLHNSIKVKLRGDFLQIRVFFVKNAQNLATAPLCKTSCSHIFFKVLSRICNPKQRFTGFEVFLRCQIFRKQKDK